MIKKLIRWFKLVFFNKFDPFADLNNIERQQTWSDSYIPPNQFAIGKARRFLIEIYDKLKFDVNYDVCACLNGGVSIAIFLDDKDADIEFFNDDLCLAVIKNNDNMRVWDVNECGFQFTVDIFCKFFGGENVFEN